jgi:hypothetical protein
VIEKNISFIKDLYLFSSSPFNSKINRTTSLF